MNVLQVGNTDSAGRRFNGADLHRALGDRGVNSQLCVWEKHTTDEQTWRLADRRRRELLRTAFTVAEQKLSVQSLLYPFSLELARDPRFKTADLVHYHLIHTGFFSLAHLPLLTRKKPSVWTLHDPWALTGHCVHPLGCERWKSGCGSCPNLATDFPMRNDRTAFMWRVKKRVYRHSQVDLVVASNWMMDLVRDSPLLSRFRLHRIPFGLDLNVFKPGDVAAAKRRLGVIPDSLVIAFRATPHEYKGLKFIKECLHEMVTDRPVCLLTFHERGLVDEFRGRFQIIELGWVNDDSATVAAYQAADVFLMPSIAESFGMMAMEAMACGKPVIVFRGTPLTEVVHEPHGGIVVERSAEALRSAVEMLLQEPERRVTIGEAALQLARQHYDVRDHVSTMIELYEDVIARRRSRRRGVLNSRGESVDASADATLRQGSLVQGHAAAFAPPLESGNGICR